MSDVVLPLFGSEFMIGGSFPQFRSLHQIKDLARDSHHLIGTASWTKTTTEQAASAEADLRAGFIGGVTVHNTTLTNDGKIVDTNNRRVIDGLLFSLEMTFRPTGKQPIEVLGGLAIGNGSDDCFEIRAYDLERGEFGKIAVPALQEYLERSRTAGGIAKASRGRKNPNRGTLQG